MRFATLDNGTSDGRLHVISRDNSRAAPCKAAETLQAALDNWDALVPVLEAEYQAVNDGKGTAFDPATALAPLPRAWQWLDGSAFKSHGDLMDQVFGLEIPDDGKPLMYQGLSNQFYSATDDVVFRTEDDGIDFEGEFGVITKSVPIGTDATAATDHIVLVGQINDWSLRKLGPTEMKKMFGVLQCKPACSMAPVVMTPDELGDAWRDNRVDLPLNVAWNGKTFGRPNGYEMSVGFHELVAHAAYSRSLPAGTIIGSGTVSNATFREIGSACIAERRGIEVMDTGAPVTPFMSFGDRVHMECRAADDSPLFGVIDQRVVEASI